MQIEDILIRVPHNPHYLQRYIRFIQSRGPNTYGELHHICPKAPDMFPEYASLKQFPWNVILLSTREHYIAHWLLWKAYGKSQSQAFFLMSNRTNKRSSRVYESVRAQVSNMMSGENNPNYDGSLSRKAWANEGSASRRIAQSERAKKHAHKRRKPKEERKYTCVICNKVFTKLEFSHHPIRQNVVCGQSCNGKRNGKKTSSPESRAKISAARKGKAPWNKGRKSPETSGENNVMKRPEQRQRMSEIAKRRRKFTNPDGSWTWIYVDDCLDNKEQSSNPQSTN